MNTQSQPGLIRAATPPASLCEALGRIVGAANVLTDPSDLAAFSDEPRGLWRQRGMLAIRPGSTDEVAEVMRLCLRTGTAVVPQGGNTGLVGGQIPASAAEIVLSLRRLNRIRDIDLQSQTMTAEAGVTLARAQEEADRHDRLFPLSLASEGSCTIGGTVATNAGGTAVLAYGNMRELVNGIEVVLADGRVLRLLSKLKKDNTGYDLRNLFIGSEGTLGIVTAAVLKLSPKPRSVETALLAVRTPQRALDLLLLAQQRMAVGLKAFELLPRIGLEIVVRHDPACRDPFGTASPWYVLIEVTDQEEGGLDERLASMLVEAVELGHVEDCVIASSLPQRKALWRLRERLSELQGLEGASIKHDVSVPVAAVPEFIARAGQAVAARFPGARPVPFGHLGDGNVHYNVSQPVGADPAAFLAHWHAMNAIVHEIVATLGGSISAEHGIGILKRDLLPAVKDPVAFGLMREVKALLDPANILNPGKVL